MKRCRNYHSCHCKLSGAQSLARAARVSCIALGTLFTCASLLPACGENVTEKYAPENAYEKAELDMERSQFTQASEKLEGLLAADPSLHKARSLLAAAYAAQAGITALGLIKGAATASTASGSPIETFNQILPEATTESLSLMDEACASMALIPEAELSTEMTLQRGLFYSAYAFLQIKFFATNAAALANITATDAAKLILTLANAAGVSGNSTFSTLASTMSTSIASVPGDDVTKVKVALGATTP